MWAFNALVGLMSLNRRQMRDGSSRTVAWMVVMHSYLRRKDQTTSDVVTVNDVKPTLTARIPGACLTPLMSCPSCCGGAVLYVFLSLKPNSSLESQGSIEQ